MFCCLTGHNGFTLFVESRFRTRICILTQVGTTETIERKTTDKTAVETDAKHMPEFVCASKRFHILWISISILWRNPVFVNCNPSYKIEVLFIIENQFTHLFPFLRRRCIYT